MKRKLSLILILSMLLSVLALSGCGGSAGSAAEQIKVPREGSNISAAEPEEELSPYIGRWIAAGIVDGGISFPMEYDPQNSFELDVREGGKVEVILAGDSTMEKWRTDGDEFVLTLDGVDVPGYLQDDAIVFEEMFDDTATVYFGREGTAAADPMTYETDLDDLPDYFTEIEYLEVDDETLLGTWVSAGYSFALEDPIEYDPEPLDLDDIGDLLILNIKPDHTVDISFNGGSAVNTYDWYIEDGYIYFDVEDPYFDMYYREDGIFEVFITTDDSYMEVYCEFAG